MRICSSHPSKTKHLVVGTVWVFQVQEDVVQTMHGYASGYAVSCHRLAPRLAALRWLGPQDLFSTDVTVMSLIGTFIFI